MDKPLFKGICTALVTPFKDENINYDMLIQLINRQINAGVKNIVLSGTTGEASTLSDAEKISMFHAGVDCKKDNCSIIAGTGSNATTHAVMLSKEAEKAGVDALLVVTPYYNKATDEGLYQHYLTIAKAVNIPIIVYNVPGRTGVDIPISVYKRLCTIENIIGVKEASASITKITKILTNCPDFQVWTGNDEMIVPAIALGSCGGISVISNVLPKESVTMANAALNGNYLEAAKMQRQLQPLIEQLFCEVNPVPAKEALSYLGFDCGGYRLPLTEMTTKNKENLYAQLKQAMHR